MYIANYEDGWETHQLGMNWGYDGSYDYLWLEASSYSDWVSNTTYDTERYMLKIILLIMNTSLFKYLMLSMFSLVFFLYMR